MAMRRVALCGATLFSLLSGCSGLSVFPTPIQSAQSFAVYHGFAERIYQSDKFRITSFVRKSGGSPVLKVYIEGDGAPWRANLIPPSDPTPRRSTVLEMAAQDRGQAVMYLARPCQYLDVHALQDCSVDYWTAKRFSAEVIDTLDNAITQAMRECGAKELQLVGYSGGGTIALYLTERRDDVTQLTTIASPLNHVLWTEYHDIAPLTGSLAPVIAGRQRQGIRQTHVAGEKDAVVPPQLMREMLPKNAALKVMPGFDHECCWAADWGRILVELGLAN